MIASVTIVWLVCTVNEKGLADLHVIARRETDIERLRVVSVQNLQAIVWCLGALVQKQWAFHTRLGPLIFIRIVHDKGRRGKYVQCAWINPLQHARIQLQSCV